MCLSKSVLSCWGISGTENVSVSESSWIVGVVGCLGWKKGSPFAVANLPGNVGDSLGRHPLERAEKLGDYGGAFADDGEKVARDFPRQGEQGVGVFAELQREAADVFLPRRCLLAALDFTEVGRLYADALGDFADGKGRIFFRQREPLGPHGFTKF